MTNTNDTAMNDNSCIKLLVTDLTDDIAKDISSFLRSDYVNCVYSGPEQSCCLYAITPLLSSALREIRSLRRQLKRR